MFSFFKVYFANFSSLVSLNDVPESWQFGFQDPATPMAEGMISFHHYLMYNMIITGVVVLCFIDVFNYLIELYILCLKDLHIQPTLEIIWTIIPAIILLAIAAPSFSLLYSLDEVIDPDLTLKVVGHQWYWSYEYSDPLLADDESEFEYVDELAFDSYMVPEEDLVAGQLRLLEVDNRICLPEGRHIRVLVTSADVLHSWAIPKFWN